MARTPKLGGELPAYNTMGAKPKKTRMAFPNPLASTGSGKNVGQRAPKVSMGTPGSKNFVQRTPGGVSQRMPGNSSQRMPSVMPGNSSQRMPATFRAPRKPAK